MVLDERLLELSEEFGDLKEPLDRYTLLLKLAAYAPQPPCDFTTKEYLYHGCQTNLWLYISFLEGRPEIRITSDSMLMRGVALVLMRLLDGLPPGEYKNLSRIDVPEAMGLSEMFTSRRHLGLSGLLGEIERQIEKGT